MSQKQQSGSQHNELQRGIKSWQVPLSVWVVLSAPATSWGPGIRICLLQVVMRKRLKERGYDPKAV